MDTHAREVDVIVPLLACAPDPGPTCEPGALDVVAGVRGTAALGADGRPATETWLSQPQDVTIGPDGTWWVADYNNHIVREIDPDGIARVVAGSGFPSGGDGGPALAEPLDHPTMVVPDPVDPNVLWLAATGNQRIGRVDRAASWIDFPYGTGFAGFAGDGGPAAEAWFWRPSSVAFDGAGVMYVSDRMNQVVRAVAVDGTISTVVGTPGVAGYGGDGGPATEATLNAAAPTETDPGNRLAVRGSVLLIADTGNDAIRRVDLATGIITTLIDGLSGPHDVAISADGARIAVTNTDAGDVRVFDIEGAELAAADGFEAPIGLDWGTDGAVYVADRNQHVIIRWCAADD